MTDYEKMQEAIRNSSCCDDNVLSKGGIPILYHYRTFESFWDILKSDCFWATNARFCNDDQEQKFGREVINAIYESEDDAEINDTLDEKYIVCFCEEKDKLSQWRGYAPDGGVAMGFDFGAPRIFSILYEEETDVKKGKCSEKFIAMAAVCYIEPFDKEKETIEKFGERCKAEIDIDGYFTDEAKKKLSTRDIQLKAPYIKHSGFKEEQEYRLVFSDDEGVLKKCIRYRQSKDSKLKYPYIVAKTAIPVNEFKHSVVRVALAQDVQGNSYEPELVKRISACLTNSYCSKKVCGCHLPLGEKATQTDSFCAGCTIRRMENVHTYHQCRYKGKGLEYGEFFLHECENSVTISQGKDQEEIFEKVYECVQKFQKEKNLPKINVWCEGHLPLRQIVIGPCPNQESMKEAIQHYCKHKYWLRDVEIITSRIPFRKTL